MTEEYIDIYELYKERIDCVTSELKGDSALEDYFRAVCDLMRLTVHIYDMHADGSFYRLSVEDKKTLLDKAYAEQTLNYGESFLNPDVAADKLGKELGQILSAVYAELISTVIYAYEEDIEALCIRLGLFLECYGAYRAGIDEGTELSAAAFKTIYSDYAFDYTMDMMRYMVKESYSTDNGVAGRIIESADLTVPDYLYDYGEYITDNEVKLVKYMATLPEDKIKLMADVFTDGYIRGFAATGKDISIKNLVQLRYPVGFERVVREAAGLFAEAGLNVTYRRYEPSFAGGRQLIRNGYSSTIANRQFEADHENDRVLYYDRRYMEHRLMCYKNAHEEYKIETGGYGGPAVMECFGEKPVFLEQKESALKPDEAMNALVSEYSVRASNILNTYVKGEERSFTIIAFPTPAIGEDFEAIFDETIGLNTLDYKLYQDMQQIMIDTLDKAQYVRITGRNGNETDLTVAIWPLKDPEKETAFETCVADVNIPVGEVFTSPVLEGTNGLLHVKSVYLEDMPYTDLKLWIKDGMIEDYSCGNYDSTEAGREYIKKYLLFSHDTLPMGEFAIGTNTTAYMMCKKYSLHSVMPILIAEKTGPHFAMGDTCYSHEEDVLTYNPDGKAIVARYNSVSAKRNEDPLKAYFGCHTDITIPYDELDKLSVISGDETTDIISEGRFVLKGTESLNDPFDKEI